MTGMKLFTVPSTGKTLLLVSSILSVSCAPALAQMEAAPGNGQAAGGGMIHPTPGVQGLHQQVEEEKGTIRVTGQAQLSVPADEVRISFSVETEAATAGEATSGNARRMDAVLSALRGSGIEGLDIETFGYNLWPEYQVPREASGARTISGYRAENNIRVTLSDLAETGRILDQAVGAGANRIASLDFSASDTREARLQALREAVASARDQAEAIASAMGVRLGKALEVQGGASAPNPRSPGGAMLRAAAEISTPVEAGDLMVSASVTISYQILEGGR